MCAARGEVLARQKLKRRLWTTVIILGTLLTVTVALLLWVFVINQPAGTPGQRPPLAVSRDQANRFRSVNQALQAARPGDVIELYDDILEENIIVDEKVRGVTLQAAPGKEIHWVSAHKKDEKVPLIRINKAAAFTLKGKGILLDGLMEQDRKVRDLVLITGFSRGITVEDLAFTNIGKNGILIMNAQGDSQQPIRLANLACRDTAPVGIAGIALDANAKVRPDTNDYIDIDKPTCFPTLATPIFAKDNTVLGKYVNGVQ